MDVKAIYGRSLERVQEVRPSMDCGLTPGCDGNMEPRHSVLTEGGIEPYAEDIQLKCTSCRSTQKHGIGVSKAAFEDEMEARDDEKVINFVTQWPEDERQERLEALGYVEQ